MTVAPVPDDCVSVFTSRIGNVIPQCQAGDSMSIVKRHLAEQEERLVLIEEICIDTGALVLDTATDEVYFSADEAAYKNAYVTVFQAWAKGTIKGTAEQIFEATKSILED
ncbi:hypothetical protein CO683_38075 [Bradyrhizobium ottawaense]|nr:hypothetical protein CO683_38075 [Bradyrhizobium ottawaense]